MWYDLLTLAILVIATIRGAQSGLVWQLAVIGTLVFCFLFAGPLSLTVAPSIPIDPPLNRWLAMLGIYLVFSFLCFAIARQARDWIKKARFVEYDRHVGAILGFLKGVMICLVLTFFAVTLSANARSAILQSHSGHAAAVIIASLCPVVPQEWHDTLEPHLRRLGHSDESHESRQQPLPDGDSEDHWPRRAADAESDRDTEPLENPGLFPSRI